MPDEILSPFEFAKRERDDFIRRLISKINSESSVKGVSSYYDKNEDAILFRLDDAELLRKFHKICGIAPEHTEYELELYQQRNVGIYLGDIERNFVRIAENVKSLMPSYATNLKEVPIIVDANTKYNGWARPVPDGGSYIGVYSGIVSMWLWITAYNIGLDRYENHVQGESYRDLFAAMPWYAEQALCNPFDPPLFSVRGFPSWAYPQINKLAHDESSENYLHLRICDHFILAHELGHIALGHIENIRYSMPSDPSILRQFEFEADSFAAEVFLKMCKKEKPSQYIHPLFGLFEIWHVYEKKAGLSVQSHPTALERFGRVCKKLTPEKYMQTQTLLYTLAEVMFAAERDAK